MSVRPSPAVAPERPPLAFWLQAMVVALVAAAYSVWNAWPNTFVGLFTDTVSYLRMADVLAPWSSGTVDELSRETFRTTLYPPLYPWLLGLLGAGTNALARAQIVHALTVGAAIVALAAWLRSSIRQPSVAVLATALVALTPAWWSSALKPCSEPLFAALLALSCLGLRRESWLLAGAAIGAAWLTRAAGIALLPVLVVALARARVDRRTATWACVLAIAPALLWKLTRLGMPTHSYTQEYLRMLDGGASIPGALLDQVRVVSSSVAGAAAPGLASTLLGGAVLAAATLSLPAAWRARRPEVVLVPVYLGLVLVWPFPHETRRLLMPLLPALVLVAYEGIARVRMRFAGPAVLFLSLLLAVGSVPMLARAAMPVVPELRPYRNVDPYYEARDEAQARRILEITARVDAALQSVPQGVPPDACVYATTVDVASFVAGRRFRMPPPPERVPLDQGCRYYFISILAPSEGQAPSYYPRALVEGSTRVLFQSVIAQGESGELVAELRVRD